MSAGSARPRVCTWSGDLHDHGYVPGLRVHALLLPCGRERVRQELSVRQYAAAPSFCPSQHADHDGNEHEPDLPHRRLAVRHVGPRVAGLLGFSLAGCSATCSTDTAPATSRRVCAERRPRRRRWRRGRRWPSNGLGFFRSGHRAGDARLLIGNRARGHPFRFGGPWRLMSRVGPETLQSPAGQPVNATHWPTFRVRPA